MSKLNILLAKTDSLAPYFKGMIGDFLKMFSNKQGAFLGEKRTYDPQDGTIDEPNMRGNMLVQTTVDEKLEWFKGNASDYIDALFAQEATNASGKATAELIVDGESWGELSSLELLRLKNIVDTQSLHGMIAAIPVRSDSEEWIETDDEMYKNRAIWETPKISGTKKTTEKEDYILKDPNVSTDSPNYTPVVAHKTTTINLGEYSQQRFSGQWSQRQKADALKRRATLTTAIIEALKKCNEVESVTSAMSSDKIFDYLFEGKS